MINFCTLFDSNYSAKGLAMYESLVKHCLSFHLYVFAFDEELVRLLEKLNLECVTVITLKEFEDEELLSIKSTRTRGEYCWTCTSSTILYCLEHFDIPSCTYLDSDLFFFADPKVLIDEMGDDDVLLTEHRYSPQYDQTALSGKYCVQFMTFKNTSNGLNVLKWWRDACLEWCYARAENGKFGDQKYLDDWPAIFKGIHVLQHLGGGLAPWNMQQYTFRRKGAVIEGRNKATGSIFSVVFFHFHGLTCSKKGCYREIRMVSEVYSISKDVRKLFYNEYMSKLLACSKHILKYDNHVDCLSTKILQDSWYVICKRFIKCSITRNKHYEFLLKC